jgi:hypothetical protein
MFSGIGSFFGKMFGTDKAFETIVDSGVAAIDKLYYSKEEQADDRKAAVTEFRTMIVSWMDSTKGQNLARRLLALMISVVWLSQYVTMMGLSVVAVWVDQPDKFVESSKIIGDYAENMNGAMMLILAFYFAAPHMDKIVGGAMNKFSGTKG